MNSKENTALLAIVREANDRRRILLESVSDVM